MYQIVEKYVNKYGFWITIAIYVWIFTLPADVIFGVFLFLIFITMVFFRF